MGLQISRKGEILVDGRPPKGWRERLWAWLVTRNIDRQIREVKARAGLSDEQKAALDRAETLRVCVRRKWLNALTCALAAVNVPVMAFTAWTSPGWKAWLALACVPAFAALSVRDHRKWLQLRREELELIVDDVHDL
jgi:hypothetical protein